MGRASRLKRERHADGRGNGKGSEFTCAMCGETFTRGLGDVAAWAEARALWHEEDLQDAALVCDDCYNYMTAILPPARWNALQRRHEQRRGQQRRRPRA